MKILLKIIGISVLLFILIAGVIVISFNVKLSSIHQRPSVSIREEVIKADIEIGKRLYFVRSGCVDCHDTNLSGKLVLDNPAMGKISGANITPFKLKDWSDDDIAIAIRYGIHKSGRSLNFMPSFDYEGLSKQDIAALVAFLRSVPEVNQENSKNTFGPIAKMLSVFGKMPVMFPAEFIDSKKGFAAKPEEGPTIEFGKYLSNSCIGCHGTELKGGPIPGGDPAWPPAANIRLGSNSKWTEQAFYQMIKTGKSNITGQDLRPPMPIALLKQMNDMEIKAIWLYLSSLTN